MTYQAKDLSAQEGKPFYLYHLTQGSEVWLYTNYPIPVEHGGNTYLPSSIGHSEVKQTGEISKDGISLVFPKDDPFAAQFLGYSPDLVTSVTLYRGHFGDADNEVIVYWKGRVVGSKTSGMTINVECESIFTSLRRPGLRARFQRTCRHALYNRGCALDPEDFALTAQVTAASTTVVVVPDAASQPDGYYTGGMVRSPDDSLRLVSNHYGENLVLSRPSLSLFADLASSGYGYGYGKFYGGVVVKLYPGCDRMKATCIDKFNNLPNFGGFPYIPTKNPFGGSSIV